jgi:murein DD-endopeptidase MepM/ murein hydrolase activator NlpD
MPSVGPRPSHSFVRRKPSYRIIIARGENVRSFNVKPWLTGAAAAVGVLFGVLYLAATGYLVFRDDLLAASIARQARMQHAYEDRIASLRADIDRLTSRQLLNQEAFDAKMDRLLGRQAALDARQDIIAGLSQAARRVGLAPAATASPASPISPAIAPMAAEAPLPIINPATPPTKADAIITGSIAPVGSRAPLAMAMLRTDRAGDSPILSDADIRIGAVETSLDQLAQQQVAFVGQVADKVSQRTSKIVTILARLGHPVPAARGEADGVGGPFIPLPGNIDPESFRSSVALVTGEIERLAAIKRLAGELPLSQPIANAPITSGFGPRLDPFLGRPAMHPGVDFRAPTGYPVRATAAGTVIAAENNGGYGNMVDIDHGNGVTTRYGHMSEIDVTVGQVVAKGAVVGRTGSTGRSTGPHLHYEVRVDGEAIDPMRYILAGGEIGPLL